MVKPEVVSDTPTHLEIKDGTCKGIDKNADGVLADPDGNPLAWPVSYTSNNWQFTLYMYAGSLSLTPPLPLPLTNNRLRGTS